MYAIFTGVENTAKFHNPSSEMIYKLQIIILLKGPFAFLAHVPGESSGQAEGAASCRGALRASGWSRRKYCVSEDVVVSLIYLSANPCVDFFPRKYNSFKGKKCKFNMKIWKLYHISLHIFLLVLL